LKTYSITIKPRSPFGTPLKGDTIFGQLCWQLVNDPALAAVPFEALIAEYAATPFAVVSSAFPAFADGIFALKRPEAPLETVFDFSGMSKEQVIENRKKLKKKKWLICRNSQIPSFKSASWLDDNELIEQAGIDLKKFVSKEEFSHNSINRLTGTTTGDGFAPFATDNTVYAPGTLLTLFVCLDEAKLPLQSILTALKQIGLMGFGRDASTGMGKFDVTGHSEIDLCKTAAAGANALYTLAPSVPAAELYSDALFTPFTRFGRHGDRLAISGKPFKNPVIMLDEAALLFPRDIQQALQKPYAGSAVTGLSKIESATVCQGYAPYIPVRMEV